MPNFARMAIDLRQFTMDREHVNKNSSPHDQFAVNRIVRMQRSRSGSAENRSAYQNHDVVRHGEQVGVTALAPAVTTANI